MAGSFSDFLENELLDHVFAGAAYTSPSLFVALFTVAPSDSGGGTEVSGSGYARIDASASFGTASGGAIANDVAVDFGSASGGNWGTVVAFGIFDASTAGNLLAWADLTVNKTINDGDSAEFAVGDLDITLA